MLLIVAIVLFSVLLILTLIKPTLAFWLVLLLFFDPGGFIQTYVTRNMIGGLQLSDVTFVLLFVPLLSPKVNIRKFFKQPDNKNLLFYLLAFTLFYHVFVFGYVAGINHSGNIMAFLRYQRLTITGFLAIIPAYVFFRRDYKLFFKVALISSLILCLLFVLRFVSGIHFLPIVEFERSRGSGILRMSVLSYGFAQWFLYMSFLVLICNFKVPSKWSMYSIAIVIFIAEILTLTRRVLIVMFFQFLVIYILRQRMLGLSVLSTRLRKLLLGISFLLFIITLLFPKYLNYSASAIKEIFVITKTGMDSEGEEDIRISIDIPKHLDNFRSSPIIGTGYNELWYSNNTAEGGLSANDVPLTAALGMFGILGLLLYLIFYILVIKIMISSYKTFKACYLKGINKFNVMLFIIGNVLLIFLISKFTISFMSLFSDIIIGKQRIIFMIILGFLLASRDMLNELNIVRHSDNNKYRSFKRIS